MGRRGFLRRGAIGGIAALGTVGSEAAGLASAPAVVEPVPSFELEELTLAELQERLSSGALDSERLCALFLERIAALDRQGPELCHVIETNPEALEIAAQLDAERHIKGARGPLHGIPILLKDNVDTHDRMTTTAGSHALAGSIPKQDAFVAQRLREAGAVLLGKANLSEWANFRSERSSSGWSGRGGQCRNPYALDRNPCGSSSGSAAAVSANLAPLSIGTETDGSIVCPSSANGIVGIKPTVGLVSRAGIIPISHTQDTAGPMARTVTDAATLLGALIGVDPRDPATRESQGRSAPDYTRFLDPAGLRGARIGVGRQFFGFHDAVDRLMEAALQELSRLGAVLVDPAEIATRRQLGDPEYEVLLYEFKADLNAYLAGLGPAAPIRSLQELIAFNLAHRDTELPYFGQEIFEKAQEKGPLTETAYTEALEKCRRLSRAEGIDKLMDEQKLDAIVAPTGGPAWLTDLVNGDHFSGGSSAAAAVAGYPSITVPAGFVFGLPVGLSFFGRAYSEPTLLRLAYAFEQETRHRRPPRFLPTVDLCEGGGQAPSA